MKPYYLFRGMILGNIREEGDLTIGESLVSKVENKSKTYNFLKYAQVLDQEDQEKCETLETTTEVYEFSNYLKSKYK